MGRKWCCVTAELLLLFSPSVESNSFACPWTVATRLLCPRDSPGKNTGVGCHAFLQGIFLIQGLNASPALQADSLPLNHRGSP